jgi:hypothetical protein
MREKLPFILTVLFCAVFGLPALDAAPPPAQNKTLSKSDGDGLISGRLLKSNGRARPYTELELIPVGAEKKSDDMRLWAITDMRGNFAFNEVPNGAYTLSINFKEAPSSTAPYAAFYYPNTAERDTSKVFEVTDGAKFTGLSFRLPPDLKTGILTGKVVWDDGVPVRKVHLTIYDMEFEEAIEPGSIETDADGNFSVKTFIGRQYGIVALLFDPSVPGRYPEIVARGQSELVTISPTTKPVEIVLKRLDESEPSEDRDPGVIGSIGSAE